jgi:hypothetical protein
MYAIRCDVYMTDSRENLPQKFKTYRAAKIFLKKVLGFGMNPRIVKA